MTRLPDGIDVAGPVVAEVFVVWLHGDRIELTGPCGSAPWLLEIGETDHPLEVVDRLVRAAIADRILVHSTSWRRDRGSVVLSFIVVIGPDSVRGFESSPVDRAELARSAATMAPQSIAETQVLEHGLRHLAWLATDDPVVRHELAPGWTVALRGYVPEPFRALG